MFNAIVKMSGAVACGLFGQVLVPPVSPGAGTWEELLKVSPMAFAIIVVLVILLRYIEKRDVAAVATQTRVEGVIDRNTEALNDLVIALERSGVNTTGKVHT